ncbi:CRISPR-associated protein Csm3, partial [Candidatus Poribacteria bacterium]|nr:CRISPR-associated protein Csm3 [Candidatus Poribacteria bacterium]
MVTNPTTEKQWRITATIDTALCIGDSGAGETGADKSTVKTSDGQLYIPASTLKGIWRHACEVIARSHPHFVCNSPRAENMCPRPEEELEKENTEAMQNNHCIICQIFGSPSSESRIFISDLTLDKDLGAETTAIRSGVTINRSRRVAEDQRLYFTETSHPNAKFEFSGDVTIGKDITDEQIKLLSAGLKYIHAIGSGKTRGLGWISITKENITPETQS